MDEPTGPNPTIATRVNREVYDQAQAVANQLYEGNMALLARIAIKRFVAANQHVVPVVDAERELTAVAS